MPAVTATTSTASKTQTECRICGARSLTRYLDLGRTPLANSYLRGDQLLDPEFQEELALQLCENCGLSQTTKVVNPDLMFLNYLYVSSTAQAFRDHCGEMARTLTQMAKVRPGELVLDIASNDGCLLSEFQKLGHEVVGVDPAVNLVTEANARGIRTLNAYWSASVAAEVVARIGRPRIITATNVFAHVDDLHGFIRGIDAGLAEKGLFAIEFPYLLDFIQRNEFDTAYHEHLSYLSVTPVQRLMAQHGLEVFEIQSFPDLHGGTIRVYAARKGDYRRSANVDKYLEAESAFGICAPGPYRAFAERVQGVKQHLTALLAEERAKGKKIWAYGASAKGNTLANFVGLTADVVPVVVDDNPKKWGYHCPGSRMRITSIDELAGNQVDHLLLLAWNFEAEIRRRCQKADYRGTFILPVPDPKIIS